MEKEIRRIQELGNVLLTEGTEGMSQRQAENALVRIMRDESRHATFRVVALRGLIQPGVRLIDEYNADAVRSFQEKDDVMVQEIVFEAKKGM